MWPINRLGGEIKDYFWSFLFKNSSSNQSFMNSTNSSCCALGPVKNLSDIFMVTIIYIFILFYNILLILDIIYFILCVHCISPTSMLAP